MHPRSYDLGRDEVVRRATVAGGTTSPITNRTYEVTAQNASGPGYFANVTTSEINHGIATDGIVAVLTVRVTSDPVTACVSLPARFRVLPEYAQTYLTKPLSQKEHLCRLSRPRRSVRARPRARHCPRPLHHSCARAPRLEAAHTLTLMYPPSHPILCMRSMRARSFYVAPPPALGPLPRSHVSTRSAHRRLTLQRLIYLRVTHFCWSLIRCEPGGAAALSRCSEVGRESAGPWRTLCLDWAESCSN